jgi:hypothetical protein
MNFSIDYAAVSADDLVVLLNEAEFLADLPAKLDDTNDEVLYQRPSLITAAIIYVSNYTGDFEFMVGLKSDATLYGFRKWSGKKFRGALNCLRAEAIRVRRAAAPTPAVEANVVEGERTIPLGTYTAVFADGSHTTLRVKKHWVEEEAKAGVKVIQYLSGDDNESSYTGFAFLRGTRVNVWRKFADQIRRDDRLVRALKIVLADPAKAGEEYALESNNCFRCGRKLTVPASIHRGLGPECATKWGA